VGPLPPFRFIPESVPLAAPPPRIGFLFSLFTPQSCGGPGASFFPAIYCFGYFYLVSPISPPMVRGTYEFFFDRVRDLDCFTFFGRTPPLALLSRFTDLEVHLWVAFFRFLRRSTPPLPHLVIQSAGPSSVGWDFPMSFFFFLEQFSDCTYSFFSLTQNGLVKAFLSPFLPCFAELSSGPPVMSNPRFFFLGRRGLLVIAFFFLVDFFCFFFLSQTFRSWPSSLFFRSRTMFGNDTRPFLQGKPLFLFVGLSRQRYTNRPDRPRPLYGIPPILGPPYSLSSFLFFFEPFEFQSFYCLALFPLYGLYTRQFPSLMAFLTMTIRGALPGLFLFPPPRLTESHFPVGKRILQKDSAPLTQVMLSESTNSFPRSFLGTMVCRGSRVERVKGR